MRVIPQGGTIDVPYEMVVIQSEHFQFPQDDEIEV